MKTIVIDYEPDYFHSIEKEILSNCPQLNISGYASCAKEACKLIEEEKPSLVFVEVNMPNTNAFQILNQTTHTNFETIFISHSSICSIDAIKFQASGYLLKPLKLEEILTAVEIAEDRIRDKNEKLNLSYKPFIRQGSLFPDNILSIPTMEGLEFIPVEDIIRCEGFQRCTRIITADRSDILSSYHIGFFKKRLGSHLFYLTHKSHLINLQHIRKYLKEGSVKMTDGTFVPVSKRRKSDFLKLIFPSR